MLEGLTLRQKLSLLERFSDPEEIYNSHEPLPGVELDKDLTQAQTLTNYCRRKNIGILVFGDVLYPKKLRNIADPPLVLYYKGVLPDFDSRPLIGVVGTRKASSYGLNQAKTLSSQLAACGGVVVSGGAGGIDTWALEGAVAGEGTTVAVLGCGVEVTYPTTNRALFTRIQANGCLISEYLPTEKPKRWYFPARNRIISGLSDGVLVVEAPEKSGALITANDAAEQGRDVFVVPGNIDNKACAGSNNLLREGAIAVFSGWDILREYENRYATVRFRQEKIPPEPTFPAQTEAPKPTDDKKVIDKEPAKTYSESENITGLSETEKAVVACLSRMPRPVDEVIADTGLQAAAVLSALTMLTLKGVVANHPGKLVSLNKQ